jgi:hypothetical protein
MRYPHCRNCGVPARGGIFCLECGRMIVATVVAELVVAVIWGGFAWLMK